MNDTAVARQKRILILGAGLMQLPAIRIARGKGCFVLAADGQERAPGAREADQFLHIDLKDTPALVAAAKTVQQDQGLDAVFTAGTDFSLAVAEVAQALSLPGLPVLAARRASDKELMRKTLADAGVNVPGFTAFTAREIADPRGVELPDHLGFPLVVKPVDSMGARGVVRVDTLDELQGALNDSCAYSRSGRVVVEEYLDGPEFSIDAIVEDNRIMYCGIADRYITFAPWFVEIGHTIPSEAEAPVLDAVKLEFERGVRALGINNGAAKGDVKYASSRAWIGEIAARLSGGFMSGWTYPLSSGVEPTSAALNLAMGLPAALPEPAVNLVCAERGIISIPGRISSFQGIDLVQSRPLVQELFIHRSPKDQVRFPRNNVEKCGSVIALAEQRDLAEEEAQLSSGTILVRLEPGNRETGIFLFGEREGWIPEAFPLTMEENRAALEFLPEILLWDAGDAVSTPSLPLLSMEEGRDWHGLSFHQAMERTVEATGLKLLASPMAPPHTDPDTEVSVPESPSAGKGGIILGSLFWRAFSIGGLQAAVWLIDTMKLFRDRNMDPWKEIALWQGV